MNETFGQLLGVREVWEYVGGTRKRSRRVLTLAQVERLMQTGAIRSAIVGGGYVARRVDVDAFILDLVTRGNGAVDCIPVIKK